MAALALRSDERIGLIVALAAHAGLVALLVFRPPASDVVMPPQRIEVTLSDDVGLISTSPEPDVAAASDIAPEIGESIPVEPEAEPEPEAVRPEPQVTPTPRPTPRVTARPTPRRTPVARPPSRPAPRVDPRPVRRSPARPGGSRIGNDFLEGVRGAQSNGQSNSPRAAAIGPRVRSALAGAISRQLKPHWTTPQGVDAELLVTILAWNLREDGSLNGTPRVVRQFGITDGNSAQASRHAEQAVRAVQLAAPFNLPPDYYDGWKRISAFRFDKRLSQ